MSKQLKLKIITPERLVLEEMVDQVTLPTTEGEITILADFAEHVSEISDEKIEKAKARAIELEKQMENKDHVDFEHFEAELERSLTRVKIADKWRTRKYRK